MTRVAISPVQSDSGHTFFNAVAGNKYTKGRTAGEALDALNEQLGEDEGTTLIIVQNYRPDCFFTAKQQERLKELMELWNQSKDTGVQLPPKQQDELDLLIEQELLASAKRAAMLRDELNR